VLRSLAIFRIGAWYLSQLVRRPCQLAYHPFHLARRPVPPLLPPAAAETARSPPTWFRLSAAPAGPAVLDLFIHSCQMTYRCLLGAQQYRHVERVIICTQNNVSGRALLSQVPHTNETRYITQELLRRVTP